MAEIDVIPAVVESDWEALDQKVALVAPFVPWVHINISDGSIGASETFADVTKLTELTKKYPHVSFEAHLLVANPDKYVRSLADGGFTRIIAHIESNDPRLFLDVAKYDEVEVGIALDGATEIDQVEPFLEEVDFVVVMTAEVGASGGTFLPEAVEKIKLIRQNYPDLPIEAVGGITDANVKAVKDAGATRIVATDYIFKHVQNVEEAIETLKNS
jgi:ribulose-phosphate 3-epimerase